MTHIDLTGSSAAAAPDPDDRSLGELVSAAATDMSTLVRQEVALAKAELAESAKNVGIGAGALGGAGVTGLFGLAFLSLAAMFGLDAAGLPLGLAALTVAGGWLAVTAVLALVGKSRLGDVGGVPLTAKTIKEDVEWARHPNS